MAYEYEGSADVDEILAHFGVKGMHWGVRNDDDGAGSGSGASTAKTSKSGGAKAPKAPKQPKAPSERTLANREKRAKRHEETAAMYQRSIDQVQKRPARSRVAQNGKAQQIQELSKVRDQNLDDAKKARKGELTSGQKKLIVGASIAVGIMAAYGAYKFVDSGDMNRLSLKGKAFIAGQAHSWKTKPELSHAMDADALFKNVVKPINPDFGAYGTKMNCRRCTFAYEMRRRGYDVRSTLSNAGTGQTALGLLNATNPNVNEPTHGIRMYAKLIADAAENDAQGGPLMTYMNEHAFGEHKIDFQTIKDGASYFDMMSGNSRPAVTNQGQAIFNALKTQPEGARGELGVQWAMGGGHSVAWEVVKGIPHVFDTQSGKKYSTPAELHEFMKNVANAGFTRLDNVELNNDFLMRWLQDA
jgi:hypothetical protein